VKIQKISKKDSKNVAVKFDNDEVLFLAYEVLVKYGLKKNDELSEDYISFLIKENRSYFIKQAAFRIIGRRPHSKKELSLKLYKKGYEKELIEETLKNLSENNYLDDFKFALQFTDEKSRKLWGKIKLKTELIKKGISSEIIERILNEKFSEDDNLSSALQLAERKLSLLSERNVPENKIQNKIISYLLSKGYEYETAKRTVDLLIK
jgi:regulatory protein